MSSLPPTPNPDQARGVTVEEIVSGTRCSPLTLKEFEAFLIHVRCPTWRFMRAGLFLTCAKHTGRALGREVRSFSDSDARSTVGRTRARPLANSDSCRRFHSLQFTVWYRSYCERFSALAPEYQDLAEPPAQRYTEFSTPAGSIRTASSIRGDKDSWWTKIVRRRSTVSERSINLEDRDASGEVGLGVDVDGAGEGSGSTDLPLFHEKPSAPPQQVLDRVNTKTFSDTSSINTDTTEKRGKRFPNLRFANLAPLMSIQSRKELPPDTPMPFIEEIQLITTTFFLPGATKELNIDARLRRHILKSLRPVSEDGVKSEIPATTHPDVFKEAAEHVYNLMERSLPVSFVRSASDLGNRRLISAVTALALPSMGQGKHQHSQAALLVSFSRSSWTPSQFVSADANPLRVRRYGVGITDMGIGIMFAMIIMYYAHARWWRIFSFLFFQVRLPRCEGLNPSLMFHFRTVWSHASVLCITLLLLPSSWPNLSPTLPVRNASVSARKLALTLPRAQMGAQRRRCGDRRLFSTICPNFHCRHASRSRRKGQQEGCLRLGRLATFLVRA